jgi:prepilin-type N-terminal cleavage/methylation domain-containing protein
MNGNAKGFTTIELIIVIVIMGIMMAIALPKLGVVGAIDLYSTARQVKSDIRYTQESAMSKFKNMTITFIANKNEYTITGETRNRELPKRSKVKFDSDSTLSFTFNSLGEPTEGGGEKLKIFSGGSSKEIKVEEYTGRATIEP